MSIAAAIISLVCFGLIVILQLALVLGAPWGELAWGGRIKGKLPKKMRLMSLSTIPIFAFAALVVLDSGEITSIFPAVSRIAVWVFAAYFTLNTLMNAISKSNYERFISGSLSLASAVCLYILAI